MLAATAAHKPLEHRQPRKLAYNLKPQPRQPLLIMTETTEQF